MAQRDEKGRFLKGASGNPKGRNPAPKEEKFYSVMIGTVSLKDWREIVAKAVEQAKRGNTAARKWLSDYLMGVPKQQVDLTSAGEALKIIVEYADRDIDPTASA